ncbi:MAG: hypothetical protein A8274_1110 [Halanaerobium sp. 4-GBenrich]|jgi:hypothetical protein|uniref:Uncharacterized protein n=1 Tax=Halanaerobium congolense TaxID=54121 RepID=A0A1G6RX15_9FIRM|nr:MAG: hypothetical protein AWL62_397 [Halanaerobium sp. T82-1]ODS49923.1 MAG: hypothetical protein A8274_1110 [Halanaerobium sp. 4-GBenrich]TDS27583.1 hypothetical protein BY453_1262 [Halanaerobium congolense]TDX43556.1 hypothetical protein C7954_1162 [Halanaerobium congolense]SDD09129.1 hypothetical protein SAMN04488597_1262 [Halanaerobium congolense]
MEISTQGRYGVRALLNQPFEEISLADLKMRTEEVRKE